MKNKIKFGIVDVILILFSLLIVALLGTHIFSNSVEFDFSPKSNIYIHALVSKAEKYADSVINYGDLVYNTETGDIIGVVKSVTYSNSFETFIDSESNDEVNIVYPDLFDIDIVISTTVTENNGTDFKVGQTVKMNVPDLVFSAQITEISQHSGIVEQQRANTSDKDSVKPEATLSENIGTEVTV